MYEIVYKQQNSYIYIGSNVNCAVYIFMLIF